MTDKQTDYASIIFGLGILIAISPLWLLGSPRPTPAADVPPLPTVTVVCESGEETPTTAEYGVWENTNCRNNATGELVRVLVID